MTDMGTIRRFLAVATLAAAAASCGDVARTGSAPVYLTIDSLQASRGSATGTTGTFSGTLASDVQTLVTTGSNGSRTCSTSDPCSTVVNDIGQVIMRIVPKDIGSPLVQATPTSNNEVTITRYHITYVRADGRNTPGVDVPYGFDGGSTGTVPATGTLTLSFELVRHAAKEEPPLVQLVQNGGIITTIAQITFFGTDRVGNQISATGTIQVEFANFGG